MASSRATNRLSATAFFAKFPGLDPFPDPSSLASPFTLKRDDRNFTGSVSNTHLWGSNKVNEFRVGVFDLDNTRQLDDPFLDLTNAGIGVTNPATFFDSSAATMRLRPLHWPSGRDDGTVFIRRAQRFVQQAEQQTWTVGDTLSWTTARHGLRMGAEFRRNAFDTNLPEEQATEFEKFDNFTQLLRGLGSEGDTQFGITDKQFRFNDFNLFLSDDWRVSRSLTLNLGVRYEFFGLPEEVNGRIGNFDFAQLANTENPAAAFIVPKNVRNTGFAAIDPAIARSIKADNNHTLERPGLEQRRAASRLRVVAE